MRTRETVVVGTAVVEDAVAMVVLAVAEVLLAVPVATVAVSVVAVPVVALPVVVMVAVVTESAEPKDVGEFPEVVSAAASWGTDAPSTPVLGCKLECGDARIPIDVVSTVSFSALIWFASGWSSVSGLPGPSVGPALPTKLDSAGAWGTFVFIPAVSAINFLVVSFLFAVAVNPEPGFRFRSRFVVQEFLPQHLTIVLRRMLLAVPAMHLCEFNLVRYHLCGYFFVLRGF
jgi:hypothetical protein